MKMDFPLLIFTDLDGSLLDHHSYTYGGAEKTLKLLRRYKIPLILASSKTKAEILRLQEQLELNEPFIAENGGGIFMPADYTMLDTGIFEKSGRFCRLRFGRPYREIREVFVTLRDKYTLKGFGDMSVEEVIEATGLDRTDALLAQQRDFTEPFLFMAEPRLLEIKREAADRGLKITRGGRFYHLMAADQDKGRAVTETTRLFQAQSDDRIITAGLGDAENDYVMLRAVDLPVLIPKPDGSYEDMDLPGLRRAPYPGSRGWGVAVEEILHECDTGTVRMNVSSKP
jgi:mannosyl-3-phosphoglycerate phosphatase